MTIALPDFIAELTQNPALFITVLLTLGVILVNGWTDAPNAIATCVSTRSMGVRPAIIMAAVFNFLGVLVMTAINKSVAETIYNMVDFGGNAQDALVALCAAMFAIVVWATLAWWFGIPTSESHALIAGISGGAIAIHNSLSGINGMEWIKVIYGLVLSTFLGFAMGWLAVKLTGLICRRMNRKKTTGFFQGAQIASAGAMAFMHGAQDGQKFIGVFMLGLFLSKGESNVTSFVIPIWLMILFAADLAGAGCLLISSVSGLPVSTTHTKTTAIMGVGASKGRSFVNWGVVKDMVLTWVLTFPACGLIGYLMARLFLFIF